MTTRCASISSCSCAPRAVRAASPGGAGLPPYASGESQQAAVDELRGAASHLARGPSPDPGRRPGERFTFFCGGSRNFSKFQDLFDGVFVLEIDLNTLNRRLDQRPEDEFGARQPARDLIVRLHRTKEDTPKNGIPIDATAPLAHVVDEILRQAKATDSNNADPA